MGNDARTTSDAERALARYAWLLEVTDDAVWEWEIATGAAWWSDRQYEVLGYGHDVTPGFEAWAARIHPDDRTRVLDGVRSTLATDASEWSAELRYARPDGRVIVSVERACVERSHDGTPIRMIGVGRARHARREHLETLGRRTAGIAHDFNNFLTVILTGIEVLSRTTTAAADTDRELLDDILGAARRAAALVERLTTLARDQSVATTDIDLELVCIESRRFLRRLVDERIELQYEIAPQLGSFRAERVQIERVLQNLVLNARDAMAEGGRVTISTTNRTITDRIVDGETTVEAGDYVELAVSDHGTGIPPDVRAHMFEAFVTTKAAGRGIGLGLTTVHNIVRDVQGAILVETSPRGTTVRILFPRID